MKDRMIQNGIEYERRGEQYYPLLDLGEQTTYEIGKYGRLHLEFIKQHRRGTYTTLLTENRLNEHLQSKWVCPKNSKPPILCAGCR